MLGIYKIKNLITSDIYIGSCSNFNVRKGSHLCLLRQGKHHSIILQRAFDKYKEFNFSIVLIENVIKENLIKREQYYIDSLKPKYNICRIAGSTQGRVFTEEHRSKLSKSLTGKIRTQEQKETQRQLKLGKTHTQNTKDKVSIEVNKIKGNRVGDKINKEQIIFIIDIINSQYQTKTIKSICKDNFINYRSVLRLLNNQTWKEYYYLILPEVITNFQNKSLTKKK